MLLKALVLALVVCAAAVGAQLEAGVLAAQYYPRPAVSLRAWRSTRSTQPPRYHGPHTAGPCRRLGEPEGHARAPHATPAERRCGPADT